MNSYIKISYDSLQSLSLEFLEYVANDLRHDCVKWTILYQIHNWSYVHNFFLKGVEYCVRNCNRESNFRQVSARKNTRTELEFVFPLLRLQLVIEYGQWAVAWGGWTGPACFVQQSRRERQRESVGMARGAAKISKSTSMFKTNCTFSCYFTITLFKQHFVILLTFFVLVKES